MSKFVSKSMIIIALLALVLAGCGPTPTTQAPVAPATQAQVFRKRADVIAWVRHQGGHRRQGRRCYPRHGGRRLYREEFSRPGGGRAAGQHRLPGRHEGRGQFRADADEAAVFPGHHAARPAQ